MRQDILDSLLFSQIYADGKCARLDSPARWSEEHDNALRNLKWMLSDLRTHTIALGVNERINIGHVLDQELCRRLPELAADDVRQMLKRMASIEPDAAPQILFKTRALQTCTDEHTNEPPAIDSGRLPMPQTTVVNLMLSYAAAGEVLSSCIIAFKTTAEINNDLFEQSFTRSEVIGSIDIRFVKRHLDLVAFKQVRDKVEAFLETRRDGLILPICHAEPDAPKVESNG
ncbi:hypothetical protein [Pseudomonas petrae]|uniref:hypothetical protein n=1 Tax=Pseudomonas petrae TaxID=2912190 RepID=UPI001F1694ED|nr:hypothetical protein [Pseudomonas petrae]MCF7537453.1 hypothetical protein [Pseudomonas petrae]